MHFNFALIHCSCLDSRSNPAQTEPCNAAPSGDPCAAPSSDPYAGGSCFLQVSESQVLVPAVNALTDAVNPHVRQAAAALLLQFTRKTPNIAGRIATCGAPSFLAR